MMEKQLLILVCFLIVLSGIGIVSGETLTGMLGGAGTTSTNYTIADTTQFTTFAGLGVHNIESTKYTYSLVRWEPVSGKSTFNSTTPVGNSTMFNGTIGTQLVTQGRMGYQRIFNGGGVEQSGYQWMVFDFWNVTGLTGDKTIVITIQDGSKLDGILTTNNMWGNGPDNPIEDGGLKFLSFGGIYYRVIQEEVYNDYSLTKPSGIGIAGNITKTVGGTNYLTKIYVFNGDSPYNAITSDTVFNGINTPVNTNVESLTISMKTPAGYWYNSSRLFQAGSGTPTPTPTPTPTVTLNPGEFWLTFSAEDATTGGLIPGAEIDIYSEFAGTWNNATTTSGERTIASSQGHVYDAYGSASGYVNGSALDKIAYPNQNYLIKLFPSTGLPNIPGYVNLFVSVTERETGSPISGVSVTVSTPGSFTVNGETDNTGSEVFSTSNSSVKYITVSKTGYKAETRTITTPASGNYNAVLQMSRVLVTTQPTGYIPPGGVTPQKTIDPRSSSEKDQDMMNMVRDSGPNLIQLAIVVTMISLLGLMTKGFGK